MVEKLNVKDIIAQALKLDVTIPEFSIPLSIELIAEMRRSVVSVDGPSVFIIIGSNVWAKMIMDSALVSLLDPITKSELVLGGLLGVLLGSYVISSADIPPLIDADMMYVVSAKGDNVRKVVATRIR